MNGNCIPFLTIIFIISQIYVPLVVSLTLKEVSDFVDEYKELLEYKPGDVTPNDVTFFLFSKTVSNLQIKHNDLIPINRTKKTKFIIHGYIASRDLSWYEDLTREYLQNGDYNIIQVDWSRVARSFYLSTVENIELVANLIAQFAIQHRLDPKAIHFLGHSLGAHTAAYAADAIRGATGVRVARITAFDPAGPGFSYYVSDHRRLDATDADVVDVIHTDGGVFGCLEAIGTFDIYINGGVRVQPGCADTPGPIMWRALIADGYCSHTQSYLHFIKIINEKKFECRICDSWWRYMIGSCNGNELYKFGAEDINGSMNGICFVNTL